MQKRSHKQSRNAVGTQENEQQSHLTAAAAAAACLAQTVKNRSTTNMKCSCSSVYCSKRRVKKKHETAK